MANQNKYGLMQMLDLGELDPNAPASVEDSGLLTSAIRYDAAKHNADVNALLGLFTETTTEYQTEVENQGSGRNQPLTANGRAMPVLPVTPYTIALPLLESGTATGENYLTRQLMTNRALAGRLSQLYRGDYNWVADHILSAFFQNADWSYRDILGHGALTIKPLANSDAVTYYSQITGATATDTHYLATASAIADNANPYPAIETELIEHPDNSGEVIVFISTTLKATTIALADFYEPTDAAIKLGNATARLTGRLNITLPPTAKVLGKLYSGPWVVEWPRIPSGYAIAITTNGRRPIGRRLVPDTRLQGFGPEGNREDHPFFETQWTRREGYGGLNRAGGVVQLVGNGSYSVPTGYAAPMP
jgi:hypothetical protein